jgi:hypothetical protein
MQDVGLPALPPGYDAPAEWGGAVHGAYRLWACEEWPPQFFAHSAWVVNGVQPITFNCSRTEAIPGTLGE